MRFVIPEVCVSNFHLRDGDRVADFGAGAGYFLKALSKAVGDEGRVFAVEIQKQLTERIAELARTERLSNIEVVWGDLEASGGIKLSEGTLDAAVLSNTLFQIEDKETALKEMGRTLRAGGKFFLIDWIESFNNMGPEHGMVVSEGKAKELMEAAGFTFERSFPSGEHHYGLAFKKK